MFRVGSLLFFTILVLVAIGCGGKKRIVSDEDAGKVQQGMTKAEVEALLGPGRYQGNDSYEWTTDEGKIGVGYLNGKVASIIHQGASIPSEDQDRFDGVYGVYMLLDSFDSSGRLPENEAALAASPLARGSPGPLASLRSGKYVVRWGAPRTDAVWVYEKDAPINGGYASGAKYSLPKKLTAEKLKSFVVR